MATNNNNLKQFNVQHYAGPVSQLPAKLPFGDFYFAEDIEILYKYNYQGLPISLGGVGGGVSYKRAASYSVLVDGGAIGELAYVNTSEGTPWLPGTIGGTYFPSGWYLWNGTDWISDKNSIANQFETNINSLNTKVDIVSGKGLSTNDFTNEAQTSITDSATWISTNATNLIDHIAQTDNPHGVTKTQVGLDNVDNTSDLNKPLSTATINALANKVEAVAGERFITSAEAINIGNLTGINAGDQDISLVGQTLTMSSGSSVTLPDTNTQLSDSDIAALGYVKTDNNTQLSDADITALGYVKTDNDTQLIDSDIAAMGYVKTDTQLTDGDIGAFGYVKTDNNTQLSDADITALGYVKTDNDTQLSDADITALGYVKTDTQLSDQDITDLGYVKTDNDTQLTDGEIEALGYLKTPAVLPLAKGGALNLQQALLAADGQPAKTILAVASVTADGKVQGCSLGNGNVIEVFADGTDFNSNTVLYREFMQAGEPICFTGLSAGAIITSTQGFYGVSEQVNGGNESPMPLMSLGLAFTDTFCYAFRNSESPTGANRGHIYICCGPLPAEVTLTRNGNVVSSQENIALEPFELLTLLTDANAEYRIQATSPVMGAIQARMGGGTDNRFYDARLVMPTTNDGITWPRSGFVSAPYDNTVVDYYVRDEVSGSFTVSPGSPIDFDGSAGTGASDQDYEPAGATRVLAKGLISAYSGADSAGLEASPLMPTAAMSQVVAQPFHIDDSGDGGNSGVAIASPYTGTAKVYQWNDATGVADLAYTVPLTKGVNGAGVTLTTPDDQYYPASGIIANEAGLVADASYVELVGDLGPGYIVADVPITVVVQNADPNLEPTIRSQGGTTTTSIVNDDDETLMLGWTPPNIKAEITKDVDGYLRRRELDASGVVTYPLT